MLDQIRQGRSLQSFAQEVAQGADLLVEGLWESPKALLAALAQQASGRSILIISGANREENVLLDNLPLFTPLPVVDLPAWETLPGERLAPSSDTVGERYKALQEILHGDGPVIVVASLQACLQKFIPPKTFEDLCLTVTKGDTLPFGPFVENLQRMGYQRRAVAADKGEFAVRGGIIDLFPVNGWDPVRLEFWGDEVDTLRTFDPISQVSVAQLEKIDITAAHEWELLESSEEVATLLDYMGPNTLLILDDLLQIEDRYVSLQSIPGSFSRTFATLEELLGSGSHRRQTLYFSSHAAEALGVTRVEKPRGASLYAATHDIGFEICGLSLKARRWNHSFATVQETLLPGQSGQASGEELLLALGCPPMPLSQVYLLTSNDGEEKRLRKQLSRIPPEACFERGYLSSGFALLDENLLLLPMAEIAPFTRVRRQKMRSSYHHAQSEAYELHHGDSVVHLNNGIGTFLGIETQPNAAGHPTEYFLIQYAEETKLFVPLTQSHLVSKYIGTKDEIPKLDKLGSTRWKKVRAQTERAIMGYASDLLKLYAERTVRKGFTYPADGEDTLLFEEAFPYEPTADQLLAAGDVKSDMCSDKVMDRLVCGDVGFGKTEVAMRAAFKAVTDGGKQVAVLVPTTVLAMQHFDTFLERMRHFPISVEVLSRFRTPKQTKATLEGVKNGSVDILIGTHRIISGDVSFKNLGLVIIDEEQRFGVRAKEHLKKIKTNVDCLTLSATPIPRTLYMSVVGARDMSVIATPPQDRLPIETIVCEQHDEVVKNALLRELSRDGQAFVIHNRVESIQGYAASLQKLLPRARICVGHGQMGADELDTVFHTFKNGQADILVATSIVENGVDIPNANTIIIDRADRFGLAELYQLRGRVGRWNRKAYAYFLVPRRRALSEIAQKRLGALLEAGKPGGGGMRIAMRDLEIRGAGDLLGTEQSGHVSAVGFHLYCKLLKRTISALQGKLPSALTDTKLEFQLDARLPEDYINESSLRMEIYQRLGEAVEMEEVEAIWKELRDRFGPPPTPVAWLYYLMRIKVFASRNGFTLVKIDKLSLSAERRKGKELVSSKVLLGKVETPQDLEAKVLKLLKKNWM